MLKLYHFPFNNYSRFVRICLYEYNLMCDGIIVTPWSDNDVLLDNSPNRLLPILFLEDSYLVGPVSISEFLHETVFYTRDKHSLFSDKPLERAEVRRLCDWFFNVFEHHVLSSLLSEKLFKLDDSYPFVNEPIVAKRINKASEKLTAHLKYLEMLLEQRSYLASELFSFADIAGAGAISLVDYLGMIRWSSYPILKAWYSAVKSRPSFRGILNDRNLRILPSQTYEKLDF